MKAVRVTFTESETVYRIHCPARKGDFIAEQWFDGKRWRRLTKAKREELQKQ